MSFIVFIIIFIVSFFLTCLFHELGHWAVGAFVGYKFKRLFLGPFIFEIKNSKFACSINHDFPAFGMIELKIKSINRLSKKGFVMMLLGGPIISLILSTRSIHNSYQDRRFRSTFILSNVLQLWWRSFIVPI